MLLTLNAPTPYPPLAASSRTCRNDTNGILVLLIRNYCSLKTLEKTGGRCLWTLRRARAYEYRFPTPSSILTPHPSMIGQKGATNSCFFRWFGIAPLLLLIVRIRRPFELHRRSGFQFLHHHFDGLF